MVSDDLVVPTSVALHLGHPPVEGHAAGERRGGARHRPEPRHPIVVIVVVRAEDRRVRLELHEPSNDEVEGADGHALSHDDEFGRDGARLELLQEGKHGDVRDDVEELTALDERLMSVEDEPRGQLCRKFLCERLRLFGCGRGERVLVILGDLLAQLSVDSLETQVVCHAVELALRVLCDRVDGRDGRVGRGEDDNIEHQRDVDGARHVRDHAVLSGRDVERRHATHQRSRPVEGHAPASP
mmetsp:Transcript_49685/g.129531  ORF Transcript_49685/g.129531 Transcript_49685/m.129531 type:complete len:241 (+) Transcript_49685:567-1289(+)